jgi:APA family basic amino acid/polyamine antiporter
VKPELQLNRSLSMGLLTLYGLGTTIGAGIFVLIGKVAGTGGALAPLSFVIAAVIAGLSALSFAELSSRFPESAGEAVYVKEAFNSNTLALLMGLAVAAVGIISTATIVVGFSGYLADVVAVPRAAARVGITLLLVAVAIRGIRSSVTLAAMITLIEIGLLLVVIFFGASPELGRGVENLVASIGTSSTAAWYGVVYGVILAFYAFIGFEDIVNVAEETRNASRVVPRAIVWTLVVTTILYLAVALVAVAATRPDALAASGAPLTLVFERVSGLPGHWVSIIAILSVLNGALTRGRPEITNLAEITAADLQIAASLAVTSRHPVCAALVRAAGPVVVRPDTVETPGMGLVSGQGAGEIRLGNRAFCGIDSDRPDQGTEL